MTELNNQAYSRNLGFLSQTEQEKLQGSCVAIAGAGGDGGMLAVQLARMGVGRFKLADPDPFEVENLNRQACCTVATIGSNKAEVIGEYIQSINPRATVDVFSEGIRPENAGDFVDGSNLLIDETEFTLHSIGVSLARKARAANVPNLMAMNIGFGATVTSFHPQGKTFESTLGLSSSDSLDDIDAAKVDIRKWLPYIPPYGDHSVLAKVSSGEKSAPSVAPGVALAASIATTQALLHLVGGKNHRSSPVYAPRLLVMDAMTGRAKTIRFPAVAFYRHAAVMATRSMFGLNPRVSY